jgi:hypothetical protein
METGKISNYSTCTEIDFQIYYQPNLLSVFFFGVLLLSLQSYGTSFAAKCFIILIDFALGNVHNQV